MKTNSCFAAVMLSLVLAAGTAGLRAQDISPEPPTPDPRRDIVRLATMPAPMPTTMPTSGPTTRPIRPMPATNRFRPMMPTTGPIALPSTGPATLPATKPAASLLDCEDLLNKGYYAQAREGYQRMQASHGLLATVGLAEAFRIEGQYAKAFETLKTATAEGEKNATWRLAMYEVCTLLSKYAEALDHAKAAHELRPDWAPAVFAHGFASETVGRKAEAIEIYKALDAVLKNDSHRKDARALVAIGQIMDRHTVLSGKKASDQAQNILNNYLQEAYMHVDRRYWQARVASGMFLLQNHRPKQAVGEFQAAGKINPRIPEVFVGQGVAALGQWQFEACLKLADQALAINPNHADALLLKAACMMQWRKFDDVAQFVQKVLDVAPDHIEGLSMQAALLIRTGKADAAKPVMDKVLKVNANCATLYSTIGDWLAAGRLFKDAEGYFLKAIEMAPESAEARAALGLMYMQTGQEDKALEALTKAHALNDFREDVANYLDLVKELLDPTKYLVRETDHFIVKVHVDDKVLLDQVSDYMESIYEMIVGDYGYTPTEKTIIEILPNHAKFSVRISGKGWVGTVGACTGNLIALSAPVRQSERVGASGTLNWAVVLRHEYTHAVTLAATNNRIPHWFTEACAVFQQPDKRAYRYIKTLVDATRTGKLFPVKDIDWGFIRPKGPNDRQQAYAQSEWMLNYINDKYGYHPTVVNMLKGFRDGLTQKQVFEQVLKTTEEQFDKDFQAWAKEQVRGWRFDPEPPPDPKKAAEEARDKPDDATAQAIQAVSLYNSGNRPAAAATAQKALKIDPKQAKALAVLGYCQMQDKKWDDAIATANRLEEADPTTYHSPRVLAQAYSEKRQWDKAIAALELFKQRQPLEDYAYRELAKIYTALGQHEMALPNLLEMHKLTMDDPKWARQIADAYLATRQYKEAIEYYQQVTWINPYEVTTYEKMAALYLSAGANDKAVNAAEKIGELMPDSADAWHRTAAVQFEVGKSHKDQALLKRAKESAQKAVKIDAEHAAKELLTKIEEQLAG